MTTSALIYNSYPVQLQFLPHETPKSSSKSLHIALRIHQHAYSTSRQICSNPPGFPSTQTKMLPNVQQSTHPAVDHPNIHLTIPPLWANNPSILYCRSCTYTPKYPIIQTQFHLLSTHTHTHTHRKASSGVQLPPTRPLINVFTPRSSLKSSYRCHIVCTRM